MSDSILFFIAPRHWKLPPDSGNISGTTSPTEVVYLSKFVEFQEENNWTINEKIWDGIYPVKILKPKLGKFIFGQIAMLVVSNEIYFIAPDRPNILKADSKNKKAIKDLFFYFTVPPTLKKWLEKELRTKKSSGRGLMKYPIFLKKFV